MGELEGEGGGRRDGEREQAAEHPSQKERRGEDCGAALKGIVPSQEVQSNRARGEGAQR